MKKVRITESQFKNLIKNLIKEEMQSVNEMGREDMTLQSILKAYDNSNEQEKKRIASIIFPRLNVNKPLDVKRVRVEIYQAMRDMGYDEISEIRDEIF